MNVLKTFNLNKEKLNETNFLAYCKRIVSEQENYNNLVVQEARKIINNSKIKTMKNKVIKQFTSKVDGKLKDFELTLKERLPNNKIRSCWASLENMENGAPEVLEFSCTIPKGYTDLDLKTLNTACLVSGKEPNTEALIK